MTKQIDCSVIINAHTEGRLLHATVLSACAAAEEARLAGMNVEIIMVLDKPDQATSDYCTEYLMPSILTERVDLGDLGLARNHGATVANGEFIAFLDGDDLWGSNWLRKAQECMSDAKQELILHPATLIYFEGKELIWKLIDQESEAFSKDLLIEQNLWPAPSFAKKETYTRTKYRASQLHLGFGYEDWLWNCDTIAAGNIHKIVPDTIHCIRSKTWKPSLLEQTRSAASIIAPSALFALPFQ
jgi:glycosyltransferase involved in cell wall biosynthesis